MNDDIGSKIEQIAKLLGQDNVPDNVKELATLLASSMKKNEDTQVKKSEDATAAEADPAPERTEHTGNDQDKGSQLSPEVLETTRKALDRLNFSNDPRINLLNAIKPFMNSRRQKKIGNCIQILQVASLSRLLNDKEKHER